MQGSLPYVPYSASRESGRQVAKNTNREPSTLRFKTYCCYGRGGRLVGDRKATGRSLESLSCHAHNMPIWQMHCSVDFRLARQVANKPYTLNPKP